MKRQLRAGAAALLLLAACAPAATTISPPLDPGTRAIVYARWDGSALELQAIDLEGAPFVAQLPDRDANLEVLLYESTLAELRIQAGRVEPATDPRSARPLPVPNRIYQGAVTRRRFDGWTASSTLSAMLGALRIPGGGAEACIEGGGCHLPSDPEMSCRTPCPSPEAPLPPAAPALPNLQPCPSGWVVRTTTDSEPLITCEPWPNGHPSCDAALALFPGRAACAPVGRPCPAGDYSDALPVGRPVRHVRAGAAPGGDGSAGAPYDTIARALFAARRGEVIALAKGRYPEQVVLTDGLVLAGACAAMTTIEGSRAPDNFEEMLALIGAAASATVSGLTISGGFNGAVVRDRGPVLRLEGVVISGARNNGIAAKQGTIRAHDLLLSANASYSAVVFDDGTLEIDQADIMGPNVDALVFSSEARLVMRDVAIHDGQGSQLGVIATGTASADLSRVVIERVPRGLGADGMGRTTRVSARDVVIRDVSDTGFRIQAKARAELERIWVTRATGFALTIDDATVDASDIVLSDTRATPTSGWNGVGVRGDNGARVVLSRALLSRNRMSGLFASGSTVTLSGTDLTIADTASNDGDGFWGVGLYLDRGATSSIARARLVRNHERGVYVRGLGKGARLFATDLEVAGTLPIPASSSFGRGVEADLGGMISITRGRIHDNRNIGVLAIDLGTQVSLQDVEISNTRRSDSCANRSCFDALADGLSPVRAGSIDIDRFTITDNADYGLRLTDGSRLVLRNGRIRMNRVGALVGAEIDRALLDQEVVFEGNQKNFEEVQ